ncbi:hypothetical protein CBR_g47150 [Chara braunii]|uniref:CCHC-type domain-containing protein n=1 Tax=Chara braunii TaxID=69332 RepID=A0A388M1K0_CHABU|nr:hypothetical protein CBR_g47150 [Chara braunii]|eukprot:GBG88450.1 hypothetical protein CBR_g47150 [Chara braunii]
MPESDGVSDGPRKVLTLEDLIAAIDRHEKTPSNVPKVNTFHFNGERVSDWLDGVEQAMVGLADAVKFQRIMRYVLYGHHQEVQRVVNDANGNWATFREGMQRKYRLGDDLLTTGDLKAMNKDNFTTIGAFVQEFKKRARKVHGISEETQCAIFLGLLTASEAQELTSHGEGSTKLSWATIDKGVDDGSLDQEEHHQVRLQRQKRKERDATTSETPGVRKIITDILTELDPLIQKKVAAAIQGKTKEPIIEEAAQEGWEEGETVPPHLSKVQRRQRNVMQGGQESAAGRPGVNIVGSGPRSGVTMGPLTPQARLAQAARTRNQAKTSQEPPQREPGPGRRKKVVEVEDDDDEEEEDERLRQEEDQRAEQRAKKKEAREETEPILRDVPPRKKKYVVRLEEGFDVEKVIARLLEGHNDLMTLKEILALAPKLRDGLNGRFSRRLVPNVHLGTILPKKAEWAESGTKMDWKCVACSTLDLVVKGSKCTAMVDTGAEMNIIREADDIKFALDIDRSDCGILHGASCRAVLCGTTSNVFIEVGKVKARACFFVMPDVDHGILLGRSFFSRTKTMIFNKHDGTLILLLCDSPCGYYEVITCRNTVPKSIRNRPNSGSFTIEESEGERRRLRAEREEEQRVEAFSLSLSDLGKAMDMVAAHEMTDPDAIRALREQVLEYPEPGRLELVYRLPDGRRNPTLMQAQSMKEKATTELCRINKGNEEKLIIGELDFLLPQERTLMVELMKKRHRAYAFNDEERGRLDVNKIPMIRIHTVSHEPWNLRGARYHNPNEEKKVVDYLDDKIRTHVADYSSGLYASVWFCFIKPNGMLRWVQDLQRLNAVTVRDAGGLPNADALSESCVERPIISLIDLYTDYDQFLVYRSDRPVTAMHTPRGLIHMNVAPQGWTNAAAMVQRAIIRVMERFILRVDPTALAYSRRNYVPSDPTVVRWLTYIWMFNFELERISGNKNWADRLSRINWDGQEGEAVVNTPPVDEFLDQEEDVRLHIHKWSPRVPGCVGHPIWKAPSGYEWKAELVLKLFEEEDPRGGKDVQWMMELALASSHSLVEDMRTIEEGPGQVERHEDLMGGMYLHVNTLLQESLDQFGSLNPSGNVDEVFESQEDEFEEGEIKEAFRAEEYDGIYLELGLLLSCEVRLRDASDRAQRMLQRYLVRDGHLFVRREVGNPKRVVCGRNCQIDVIAALHDGIAGGHRGVQATYAKRRKGTRTHRRPLGASGGYERHRPRHRESTPEYDGGDIELFLDSFWEHARRMGWTVTQEIERLRGVGRFKGPVAQIRREATTRSEVEMRMQELRPSPVGPDGMPIRLEVGNASDFIPAFEWFMQGQGIPRDDWMQILPLWTRKAERLLVRQVRDMARDRESCRAHLREAFRRPESPRPRVERRQRSRSQRDLEPSEARSSRGGRKALARREEEPEPEDEERGSYPECGLGPVEFHRFTESGLRRSPARTQEEPPTSEEPLRELEAHLDISRWRVSPRGEECGEQAEAVPQEEVPREEVPQEKVPREGMPREEVQDTRQERGLGDEGRRAGKEVIEVEEDTPPQTPAVGLRLGDAPGSFRQATERLQGEEAPHLAAHALENPDLEEPAPAEPRQEPCQPEKEVEAEIPKRVHLRTRERAPAGETAEEKRARRTMRIEEIWQERPRLEAVGALPGQPPSEPARSLEIPEMWRDFWEQRGEELPSPTRAGFGVARKAEERLDRKIKFLAKTTFDRHLLLESDLAGKKKEEGHGVRLEAMEVEIQELRELVASQATIIESLRQQTQGKVDKPESSRQGEQRQSGHGLRGQSSAAEPRQEPPMGRVIVEPEEARAQREAEREAFEFRAPTELATLLVAAADPVVLLAVEEGLPPSSSESAQGLAEGPLDVLLEAVHSMQKEASLFSPGQKIDEPLEREMGIEAEGVIAGGLQRLSTPEYGPEGIKDRPGPNTQQVETGEEPLDMPQSHELSREASEAPSSSRSRRGKKMSRKWFDTSCFFCTKEGHRVLQCPKFLKDKAEGKVTEEGGRMYDRQGKRVERSADGGRAQLYRQNEEEMSDQD